MNEGSQRRRGMACLRGTPEPPRKHAARRVLGGWHAFAVSHAEWLFLPTSRERMPPGRGDGNGTIPRAGHRHQTGQTVAGTVTKRPQTDGGHRESRGPYLARATVTKRGQTVRGAVTKRRQTDGNDGHQSESNGGPGHRLQTAANGRPSPQLAARVGGAEPCRSVWCTAQLHSSDPIRAELAHPAARQPGRLASPKDQTHFGLCPSRHLEPNERLFGPHFAPPGFD
jgi:hypothetical protein